MDRGRRNLEGITKILNLNLYNMKNWKTTLLGILLGSAPLIDGIKTAYESGNFDDKTNFEIVLAIVLILIGIIAKDDKLNKVNFFGGSTSPSKPRTRK